MRLFRRPVTQQTAADDSVRTITGTDGIQSSIELLFFVWALAC